MFDSLLLGVLQQSWYSGMWDSLYQEQRLTNQSEHQPGAQQNCLITSPQRMILEQENTEISPACCFLALPLNVIHLSRRRRGLSRP